MTQAVDRDTQPEAPPAEGRQLNRLAESSSPYLLQHAGNPVDWYPWGEAAFETAREEDKPIFLSIGYSTCHWCHVMEHESFEDPEVAELLNETFVCIKVDREERPDVDNVYMTVCQMMTGSGGWPLTILMTPDKKPFYAATYIPKHSRFGRPGLMQLIPRIQELWSENREKVLDSAKQITGALDQVSEQRQPSEALGEPVLSRAYEQLNGRFDSQHGGFGTAPKFPTPHQLLFLLRYWRRSGDDRALRMVERTLVAMRRGGIYDHVGFGFHRYSTDERWLVPHFEKMLYDQALLTLAYTEAYQATGAGLYRRTVEEVVTYVLRDMTDPAGGFYSAEDADSEGEEGKFYLWTLEEVREVLGEDADLAAKVFNVQDGGNYPEHPGGPEPGKNILHQTDSLAGLAAGLNRSEEQLRRDIEAAREKLFARREERVHPGRDDKVLTDWNGLMIAALAKAGRVLEEPRYIEAASRAAAFLLGNLRTEDGRLLHRFRDGEAGITAHADDYAFLVWGLIELYESTFEVEHLRTALGLTDELLEHHWDEAEGGLYFTADDAEELLVRQKEIYDGAVPSANSVAMGNLLRLARLTGRTELEERAAAINRAFAGDVERQPVAYTQFLVALDFGVGPTREVVIAGEPGGEDTQALLRALRMRFLPRKVVLLRPAGETPPIAELAPFTKAQGLVDGQAAAYVCRNFTCERPVTTPDALLELLEPPQTSGREENR